MIPVLYSADGKRLGALADCTKCYVTEERNGIFEAEVDYPMQSDLFGSIEKGCYILAKPNDISEPQKFRIYKPSKPIYGTVAFYCEHIRYTLSGIPAARGKYSGVPSAVINDMLTSVKTSSEFTAWTDIDSVNTVNLEIPSSVGKMLAGTEGSVIDTFGGEYEFDNYNIKLHKARGQEKATEIRYAKNLTGFRCDSDITNTYTHVYPFYSNESEGIYVELPNKLITLDRASSLPFERCYFLDLSTYFNEPPTVAQLQAKAKSFIKANDLDSVAYNYNVSFIPLWQTEEYKNVAALERCGLCDTVPIIHEKAGEKIKAKIIRTVYDSLAERYVEMELGNATSNFAQTVTQSINQVSNSVKSTRSFMQIAVSRATSRITGNQGGYVVLYDSNGDGEPDEILIMDTPSIFTAKKVWRWNVSGLGYSRNGYAGPYETAITMDGEIVADFIKTGMLNASLIKTGTLLADLIKAGVISDNNGNIEINMDNGEIKMALSSGDRMQIWTNGITLYDRNGKVLASMFVSQAGNGVVTANRILVGKRDDEKTFIGTDDDGKGYVTTDTLSCEKLILDGYTLSRQSGRIHSDVPISSEISIVDDNGVEVGSFYQNAGGGATLKATAIIINNNHYKATNITVDGSTYTVLAQY
ncbi:MAG: phage tail protein [Clostridia bacterium]|nr:phage tail protein [Clostridia bacterium]